MKSVIIIHNMVVEEHFASCEDDEITKSVVVSPNALAMWDGLERLNAPSY